MFRKLANEDPQEVSGTIHIALGDNTSFAGEHTRGKIHLDGILLQPTAKVNARILMKDGKLLVG